MRSVDDKLSKNKKDEESMNEAEADEAHSMENRQRGDCRNIEQLPYKSALSGKDKSI